MENWVRVQDLGEGSYGVVWLEKKGQEAVRAVKKVSKANIILNQRELYALKELKEYPEYFVELLGSSEDQNSVYLVMEYIENGDLMGVVKNRQGTDRISENEIKSITWQLLTALEIMHSKNFCHRDLKPQNILVASTSPIRVKIADFGVTKQASDSTQLRTVVGTWGYMAPEVLGFSDAETSGYTSSADIWSLGSLLHFMFTNEVPFPDNRKLINYVRENNAPFPTEKLQRGGASLAARDFIKSLMSPFPEKRLTAKQALEAPWLKIDEPDQISPDPVLESSLPNDPELTVSLPNDSGNWTARPSASYPNKLLYLHDYNAQEEGFQSTDWPTRVLNAARLPCVGYLDLAPCGYLSERSLGLSAESIYPRSQDLEDVSFCQSHIIQTSFRLSQGGFSWHKSSSKAMQWPRASCKVTSCGKKISVTTAATEKYPSPKAIGAKVGKRQKSRTRKPRVLCYSCVMALCKLLATDIKE